MMNKYPGHASGVLKTYILCLSLCVSFLFVTGCYTTYESWALHMGVNKWRDGNYKEAIDYLEDVLDGDPRNAHAHMWLAWTYEDLGDYAKAEEYFSKALELDPQYSFLYDVGSNKIESADIRQGWRDLDSARNRSGEYQRNAYDRAVMSFNLALKKNPKSADGYVGLSIVCMDRNDRNKAIELISKAIEIEPKPGHFWVRAETFWKKKKDFERAIQDYNKVLELVPADDQSPYAVGIRKLASEAIAKLEKKLRRKNR